jgi:hypothetical protein
MLVVDPSKRADVESVSAHRWMARGVAANPAPVPHGPPPPLADDTLDAARLEALATLGVPREPLVADLKTGEVNYMTAAYHLYGCGVGGAPSGFGPPPAARTVSPAGGADAGAHADEDASGQQQPGGDASGAAAAGDAFGSPLPPPARASSDADGGAAGGSRVSSSAGGAQPCAADGSAADAAAAEQLASQMGAVAVS